jgi:4-amino-4-deoxy-L-arabinose transferase-like glycosyltransferase
MKVAQRLSPLPWLICLPIALAFLFLGIFGRDPWKPDEAYTFGLVYHAWQTGELLVPTLAGEPFMEKPPLFYWTAALFCRLFVPPLSLPDAARLASSFYVGVAALSLGLASRRLHGSGAGWPAALLLLGAVGLLHVAHLLVTDLALLAGSAVALYGLVLSLEKPTRAGMVAGIGVGMAFLAKGCVGPALFLTAALALPITGRLWRTRHYARFVMTAACTATPWLVIWPAALYLKSPALFADWLWINNLGRFMGPQRLGPSMHPLYYLTLLPWYAWPVAHLAAWTAWTDTRDAWKTAAIQLPIVAAGSMLALLSVAHARRDVYVLPVFLPLALLAARGLPRLPTAFLLRWQVAARIGFGGIVFLLWTGWLVQVTGWPAGLAAWILAVRPGFAPEFRPELASVALLATLGWIWVARRPADTGSRAVLHWTAGLTAVYGVALTLWLPMANYAMSYRPTVASLRAALPSDGACLNSHSLGESQRALFQYLGGITTRRLEAGYPLQCRWLLIQGRYDVPGGFPQAPDPGWQPVWESRRGGREVFVLFRRAVGSDERAD